jgi:2-dehydro-3-deoxygalactonokinase
MAEEFLACDWGTTQLRTWVISAAGAILRQQMFPYGVSRLKRGEAEQKFRSVVRPQMQAEGLPALLCGMIGSELGWVAVPHQRCPAGLASLAAALLQVEQSPGAWIIPGLCGSGISGVPDVMRGEETQILGWISQDRSRASGTNVICHPGTHAKWVWIEDGRIVRFVTAITGELFDVLRSYSVLRTDAPPDDCAAFDEGVAVASDGGALAARLFTARTRVIAGLRPAKSSASYLSGLLIGAEVASMPNLLSIGHRTNVNLLGDVALCRWYARALSQKGISTMIYNGEEAVVAGLSSIKAIAGL